VVNVVEAGGEVVDEVEVALVVLVLLVLLVLLVGIMRDQSDNHAIPS